MIWLYILAFYMCNKEVHSLVIRISVYMMGEARGEYRGEQKCVQNFGEET